MNSRRSFIEKVSKGAALSTIAMAAPSGLLANTITMAKEKAKIIGIIGAENSHAAGFGRMFNVDKKFPGFEVRYIWGETDEFAKTASQKGSIPNIVKDPKEMLGKIDALIVDHRHAKYHLQAATPFVKAGIPTFVDKPFCYRKQEGQEFLRLARETGTPVTSFSSIAHSYKTFDIREQVQEMGDIKQVVSYGPVDIKSEYGGIFFYGVHTVQPLLYIFGDTVEKVRVNENGENSTATLVFANGLNATLIFINKIRGWETYAETEKGIVKLEARNKVEGPDKNYVDMVEMFRTGKEPRSHESILHCVAVLEALERSVASEQWEKVL